MEQAEKNARLQMLQQAHVFFLTQTRELKVRLMMATSSGELAPGTLKALYEDFCTLASMCQQKGE